MFLVLFCPSPLFCLLSSGSSLLLLSLVFSLLSSFVLTLFYHFLSLGPHETKRGTRGTLKRDRGTPRDTAGHHGTPWDTSGHSRDTHGTLTGHSPDTRGTLGTLGAEEEQQQHEDTVVPAALAAEDGSRTASHAHHARHNTNS